MPNFSFVLGNFLTKLVYRFINICSKEKLFSFFCFVFCSLSQYIIVPASVTDSQLTDAARHFQGNRPPVWSWTNTYGAALVKMSELLPTITERMQENVMFENVRKSHPQKMPPVVIELNKDINVKLIGTSFTKFISLCSPGKFLELHRYISSAYTKSIFHLQMFIYIYFRKY